MSEPLSAPASIRYCCHCGASMQNRHVAGKKVRRVCSECGHVHFVEPKIGAGALVVAQQRLLLVRRAIPPQQGLWSLPAGYIDIDESPQQCAAREVKEETGLQVEITKLIDVYHNKVEKNDQGKDMKHQGASLFILYQARRIGGVLRAADDAAEVGFFALHELPELAFASTHDAVRRLCLELSPISKS